MNRDFIGKTYGRLTGVSVLARRSKDKHLMALWSCACGKSAEVIVSRVVNGYTKSCGCLAVETNATRGTHRMRNTKEYGAWRGMKERCHKPNAKDYPRYGGLGIAVCSEWRASFASFFSHIGPAPSDEHSIDRIDSGRGYEPGNVRWATKTEQARNRRSTYQWHIKGLSFETVTEAAAHFRVSAHTVSRWVRGSFDPRRNRFTHKREDCHAIPRY